MSACFEESLLHQEIFLAAFMIQNSYTNRNRGPRSFLPKAKGKQVEDPKSKAVRAARGARVVIDCRHIQRQTLKRVWRTMHQSFDLCAIFGVDL